MSRRSAVVYVTVPYYKVLFSLLYFFNQPIGGWFWNFLRTLNEINWTFMFFLTIHCEKTGYVIQCVSFSPTRYCEPHLEVVAIERDVKIRRPNEDVFVKPDSYLSWTDRCLLQSRPISFHSSRKVKGTSIERTARKRIWVVKVTTIRYKWRQYCRCNNWRMRVRYENSSLLRCYTWLTAELSPTFRVILIMSFSGSSSPRLLEHEVAGTTRCRNVGRHLLLDTTLLGPNGVRQQGWRRDLCNVNVRTTTTTTTTRAHSSEQPVPIMYSTPRVTNVQ